MKGWTAHVLAGQAIGAFHFVRLRWDEQVPPVRPGQFLLVRPLASWDPYLRPVVLCVWQDDEAAWWLYPSREGNGRVLAKLAAGTRCPVWGPFGQGFPEIPSGARVVVLADERHVPFVLGLIRSLARQADVVTLLVRDGEHAYLPPDWSWLPPSVEAVTVSGSSGEIERELAGLMGWADYVFTCGDRGWPALVRRVWEQTRSALPVGRVFAVMSDGFLCGLGLCDACRLTTPRGEVRLCRRGPVLDVSRWWGA